MKPWGYTRLTQDLHNCVIPAEAGIQGHDVIPATCPPKQAPLSFLRKQESRDAHSWIPAAGMTRPTGIHRWLAKFAVFVLTAVFYITAISPYVFSACNFSSTSLDRSYSSSDSFISINNGCTLIAQRFLQTSPCLYSVNVKLTRTYNDGNSPDIYIEIRDNNRNDTVDNPNDDYPGVIKKTYGPIAASTIGYDSDSPYDKTVVPAIFELTNLTNSDGYWIVVRTGQYDGTMDPNYCSNYRYDYLIWGDTVANAQTERAARKDGTGNWDHLLNKTLLWFETWKATANNPPSAPSDPYPANNATGVATNVTLTWLGGDDSDIGDTVYYNVMWGKDGESGSTSPDLSAKSYAPSGLINNQKYWWRVAATDNHGATTTGPTWNFRTAAALIPTQLTMNSVTTKYNNAVDITAKLTLSDGITPVGNKTITFYIGANEGYTGPSYQGTATTDAVTGIAVLNYPTPSTLNPGSYSLEATFAGDASYSASSKAILGGFVIIENRTTITLNNRSVISGNDVVLDARLTDVSGTNPISGKKIDFYFDGSKIPDDPLGSDITDATGWAIAKSFFAPYVTTPTNYPIEARWAGDADWLASSKSATLTVNPHPNSPPSAPTTPINPSDNATGVPTNVTLAWSGGDDPDSGDTVYYNVMWGKDGESGSTSPDLSAKSYAPSGLINNQKYWWRVAATDNHGATTTGSTWYFTTAAANNPPSAPSNPSPLNSAINVDVNADLSWTASTDPNGDTVAYDVYFGILNSASISNTWTPKESNRSWWSVAMSSDGTKQTAVVYGGQIYVSTDSGNTWTPKESNRSWYSVAMSSDGTKQTAVVYGGQIYVSTDSGNTWTPKESNRNWHSVAMSSDGAKQTAVVYYGGQIYVSTDSGNTWTPKESNRSWYSVAMSSDGTKQTAVASGGQIYVSTDSGNTWTPKESNRSWWSVAMSSDGTKQTAVVYGGQIYVSTDSGNTWTPKESNRSWYSVAMSSDGTKQTAVASGGQIYVSTDSGNTWTPKESNRSWWSVAMSSDGAKQTAVASGGQIYLSEITLPKVTPTPISSTTYDPGTMTAGSTYCWYVIAQDGHGGIARGPATGVWSFTTATANNLPYEPALLYPWSSATSPTGSNIWLKSDFYWSGGDPDGDPVTYTFYLGTTDPPSSAVVTNQTGLNYHRTGNFTYYDDTKTSDTNIDTGTGIIVNKHRSYAQSFNFSGAQYQGFDGVKIQVYKVGSPTGNLVAEIHSDSSGSPNGSPDNGYIGGTQEKINIADVGTNSDNVEAFNYTTPVCTYDLSTGTYWLMIYEEGYSSAATDSMSNCYRVRVSYKNSADKYASGVVKRRDGDETIWSSIDGSGQYSDICFLVRDNWLTLNTTYYLYIVATDSNGGITRAPSTGTWSFTTTRAPNAPTNLTPANNAVNVGVTTDLSWTAASPVDPDTDSVTYNVYFGTSTTPPLVSCGTSATTYDTGTMTINTPYYWYIIAEDAKGATTRVPSSGNYTFTTAAANNPPYEPANPNPATNTTGVWSTTNISWDGGDPDTADTLSYDIYFGTVDPPTSHINISPFLATQTRITWDPSGPFGYLADNTTYYWYIVASDGSLTARGPATGTWNFKTAVRTPKVYHVATNGDDTWNGLDPRPPSGVGMQDGPWRTINKAAQTMQAGDKAIVQGGNYGAEHIVFANSGDITNSITLEANGEVIIDNLGDSSTEPAIKIDGKSYIYLQGSGQGSGGASSGFKIDNYDKGIYVANASSVMVKNCVLLTNGDGIYLSSSNSCTIQDNDIVGSNRTGIVLNASDTNSVHDNNIYDSTTTNVSDNGTGNTWNKNYYGDYAGPDLNADGIGDTPYNFATGTDTAPLMDPIEVTTVETDWIYGGCWIVVWNGGYWGTVRINNIVDDSSPRYAVVDVRAPWTTGSTWDVTNQTLEENGTAIEISNPSNPIEYYSIKCTGVYGSRECPAVKFTITHDFGMKVSVSAKYGNSNPVKDALVDIDYSLLGLWIEYDIPAVQIDVGSKEVTAPAFDIGDGYNVKLDNRAYARFRVPHKVSGIATTWGIRAGKDGFNDDAWTTRATFTSDQARVRAVFTLTSPPFWSLTADGANPIFQANDGDTVYMFADLSGIPNVAGKTAVFNVYEIDYVDIPLIGRVAKYDLITQTPIEAIVTADGKAVAPWIAKYVDEGLIGYGTNPEFVFKVTSEGKTKESGELTVPKISQVLIDKIIWSKTSDGSQPITTADACASESVYMYLEMRNAKNGDEITFNITENDTIDYFDDSVLVKSATVSGVDPVTKICKMAVLWNVVPFNDPDITGEAGYWEFVFRAAIRGVTSKESDELKVPEIPATSLGVSEKTVVAGETVTLSCNLSEGSILPDVLQTGINGKTIRWYIDLTNDGDYSDAGEGLGTSITGGDWPNRGTATKDFTAPVGIEAKKYSVRCVFEGDCVATDGDGIYAKSEGKGFLNVNDRFAAQIIKAEPSSFASNCGSQSVRITVKNIGKPVRLILTHDPAPSGWSIAENSQEINNVPKGAYKDFEFHISPPNYEDWNTITWRLYAYQPFSENIFCDMLIQMVTTSEFPAPDLLWPPDGSIVEKSRQPNYKVTLGWEHDWQDEPPESLKYVKDYSLSLYEKYPKGWKLEKKGNLDYVMAGMDETASHSGKNSLKSYIGQADGVNLARWILDKDIEIAPNTQYHLGVWIKTSNYLGGAKFKFSFYKGGFWGGKGDKIEGADVTFGVPMGDYDWTLLDDLLASPKGTFTTPADAKYISDVTFEFGGTSIGGTGTVWFDDLDIFKGAGVSKKNPDTKITSGPQGPVNENFATFTFEGFDPDGQVTHFAYALQGPGYDGTFTEIASTPTSNPSVSTGTCTFSSLAKGIYTFVVKAKDNDLNYDPSPASQAFNYGEFNNKERSLLYAHNPGFENGVTSPSGWTVTTTGSAVGEWDDGVFNGGAKSVKCRLLNINTDSVEWKASSLGETVDPAKLYRMGVWVKKSGYTEGKFLMKLDIRDIGGNHIGDIIMPIPAGDTEWTHYVRAFGVPENADHIESVTLSVSGAGIIWFDDLYILELTPAEVGNIQAPGTVITSEKPAEDSVISYNTVTFTFTGIDKMGSGIQGYCYSLDKALNIPQEWFPITTDTTATFQNLAPGEHTFYVAAIDNLGFDTHPPASRKFRVNSAPDTEIAVRPSRVVAPGSSVYYKVRGIDYDLLYFPEYVEISYRLKGPDGDEGWSPWILCRGKDIFGWPNADFTISSLTGGRYSLAVKARDSAGAEDPTPALDSFTVNRPPTITSVILTPNTTTINEGDTLSFVAAVSDPDGDVLTCYYTLDGVIQTYFYMWDYKPGYNDHGIHEIKLTVTDGYSTVEQSWNITVNNVNNAPEITSYSPITPPDPEVVLGTSLAFSVAASDADGDPLTYKWRLDGNEKSADSSWMYTPIYPDEIGTHTVAVTVSDGSLTDSKLWIIEVTSGLNGSPYTPSNPSPADRATNVDVNADLSWTGGDPDTGDTVTYDVYFGILDSSSISSVWTPKATDANRNWQSVAMSSDGTKQTAVVSGEGIYVSTDSGNNWTPKETNRDWVSVAMSSDGTKQTAVVYGGQIYVSTDSGNNWTPKETDKDRYWISVAMSSDGTKQTAVVWGGQIYVSTDSGNNWTPKATNRNWMSVAMSSDGTKQTAVVNGGQIYVSTDSGSNWTPKETDKDRYWISVAMSSDGTKQTAVVWGGQIYVSTDSGNNWTPKATNRNWMSVAMSSDGTKQTAVVNGGQIYVSTITLPKVTLIPITSTTYDPGIMTFGTTYCWYVIAKDDDGATTTGPTWSFTTATVTPNVPPVINPPVPDITTPKNTPKTIDLTPYETDTEDIPGDGALTWSISGVNTALFTASINTITDELTITPVADAVGSDVVTLTLTDSGGLTDTQDVTVEEVNNVPEITSYQPLSLTPYLAVGDAINFSITATDADNDPLTYSWTLDGIQKSTNASWTYTPTPSDVGSHTVIVVVSDGYDNVTKTWTLTVGTNHPPVIASYSPTSLTPSVAVGNSLNFSVSANDPDGDSLTYSWTLDGVVKSTATSWTFTPAALGTYSVTVYVSDGSLTTTQSWMVYVTDASLVLGLPFEEGSGDIVYDISQYGNNGVIYGASRVAGKSGGALSFDGKDDYVSILSSTSLNLTTAITIDSWIKGSGIGFSSTQRTSGIYNKIYPQYQVVGSKIYLIWSQITDFIGPPPNQFYQIWTGEMNTDGTGWTATQRTTDGQDKFEPQLQVVGSTIYYVWRKYEFSSGLYEIYTAKMNTDGTGWVTTKRTTGMFKSWTVTVKAQDPTTAFTSYSAISATPAVEVGDTLNFTVSSSDADGNPSTPLTYTWTLDGTTVFTESGTTKSSWSYKPTTTDIGNRTVAVTITDGTVTNVGVHTYHKSAPQIQVVGSKIYYTWYEYAYSVAARDNVQIWTAEMNTDGTGFLAKNVTDTRFMKSNPQLQVVGSKIYYIWTEHDGNNTQIWTAQMNTDGTGWQATQRTTTTYDKSTPQLQVVGSKIYYIWTEHDGNNTQIWTAQMNTDGTGWQATQRTTTTYDKSTPQLQVVGSKIYYIWTEHDGNNTQIWTAQMNTDGTAWQATQRTTTTYDKSTPQLQVVGSKIYYIWTEHDGNNTQIWTGELGANIMNKGDSYGIGIKGNAITGFINGGVDTVKYKAESTEYSGGAAVSATIDSNWNHIVMTYDSSNLKLYVNGTLKAVTPFTIPMKTNTFNLIIGDDFNGFIDGVFVYNQAFAESKITTVSPAQALAVNNPPVIAPAVPDINISNRKYVAFDLTPYETDVEDGPAGDGSSLTWSVAGADTNLFSAYIDITTDELVITPVPNATGSDVITLTLIDSQGLTDNQDITVNVTDTFGASGSITFDYYIGTSSNKLINLSWAGIEDGYISDIETRVRTASTKAALSSAAWSSYFGGDITTSNFATSIPINQWIQLEAVLDTSDIKHLPVLDELTATFEISSTNTPYNPSPTDNETSVPLNKDLSWMIGNLEPSETVTFDIYFEANNSRPQLVRSNMSSTTYDPGTLLPNTTYYWQVEAKYSFGVKEKGPVWKFTTMSQEEHLRYEGLLGSAILTFDSGKVLTRWNSISFNGTEDGTNADIKLRVNTGGGWSSWFGDNNITKSFSLSVPDGQNIQIEVMLERTADSYAVRLDDLAIDYTPKEVGAPAVGTATLTFDSGKNATQWNSIKWNISSTTGEDGTNADIKARIRTADAKEDLALTMWSNYYGEDITTAIFAISPSSKRWIQIEVILSTTDSLNYQPRLDDLAIDYTPKEVGAPAVGTAIITFDSGKNATQWNSIKWNISSTTGEDGTNADIKARIRTADAKEDLALTMWSNYYGEDITTAIFAISPSSKRWIQIEVILSTTDSLNYQPRLDDLAIDYTPKEVGAPAVGTATLTFDSGYPLTQWDSILFTGAEDGTNSDVKLRIKTASSEEDLKYTSWTNWLGASATKNTFTSGTDFTIGDRRWLQIQVELNTTDSANYVPKLDDLTLNYTPKGIPASGTATTTFDSGKNATQWNSIKWNISSTTGEDGTNADIKARVRTADAKEDLALTMWSNYYGEDITTAIFAISPSSKRWIQIEVILSTTDSLNYQPRLDDLAIDYTPKEVGAPAVGTATLTFDSGYSATQWNSISFTGLEDGVNTDIKARVRTDDTWTSWFGIGNTTSSFAIAEPANQWIQIQVEVWTADNVTYPNVRLDDLTIDYTPSGTQLIPTNNPPNEPTNPSVTKAPSSDTYLLAARKAIRRAVTTLLTTGHNLLTCPIMAEVRL